MKSHTKYYIISSYVLFSITFSTLAADNRGLWEEVSDVGSLASLAVRGTSWIRPSLSKTYTLNVDKIKRTLITAPVRSVGKQSLTIISLPMADGSFADFKVYETLVMEPALAEKYPDIKTYVAQRIDKPLETARLDFTPLGFHALIRTTDKGMVFIDPYSKGQLEQYSCYLASDYVYELGGEKQFTCGVRRSDFSSLSSDEAGDIFANIVTGENLHTYRLAMSCDHDFTEFYGGVSSAMAGIVTGVNRLNGIFERDVAIRFRLVGNNDQLIFTAANDPFANMGVGAIDLVTSKIDEILGNSSYDIGHLVAGYTGGGEFSGLAGLGVVCDPLDKGAGVSSMIGPTGDFFWLRLTAHEIGHQFKANHTFNGIGGSCEYNRNALTAYEPGSGTTIMSYAGICSNDNVQTGADYYYHAGTIQEIQSFITTVGTCSSDENPFNNPPTVNAGIDYTIPKQTPFELTAVATDPGGDALTYTWEEMDRGPAQALADGDNGSSPLFRSFPPSSNPTRIFPQLSNIVAGVSNPAEDLPTTARTMNFRTTVRDNDLFLGATASDDMKITVINQGPFQVTFPTAGSTVSGEETVTWNVAGTSANPINAGFVDIFLSLDSGNTFLIPLLQNTPNDGSEVVVFPGLDISSVRLKIKARDNVFFNISPGDFRISAPPGNFQPFFVDGDVYNIIDNPEDGNGNGNLDPGEKNVQLFINLKNIGGATGSGVEATLSALTGGVVVDQGYSQYPNIFPNSLAANYEPYIVSLPRTLSCGSEVTFLLNVIADGWLNPAIITIPLGDGSGNCETLPARFDLFVQNIEDDPDPMGNNTETTVTYAVTIKNNGPDPAENVVLGSFHSSAMTFISSTLPCTPTQNQTAVYCPIGTLNENQNQTIALTYKVPTTFLGTLTLFGGAYITTNELNNWIHILQENTTVPDANGNGIGDWSETDFDLDGLPDDCERTYFGDITSVNDPNGDYDGDGISNLLECQRSTDPSSLHSPPTLYVARTNDIEQTLSFTGIVDRTYDIQSITNLLSTSAWNTVQANVQGTNNELHQININQTNILQFYRIEVNVP